MANERVKEGRLSLTLLYDKQDFKSKDEQRDLARRADDLTREIRAKVAEILLRHEGFLMVGGTYKIRAVKSACNCGYPDCLNITKEEHQSRNQMLNDSMAQLNRLLDAEKENNGKAP